MTDEQRLMDLADRLGSFRELEGAIDEEAFKDTLEGLELEFNDKVIRCIHVLEEFQAEVKRMEEVAADYEHRINRIRDNARYLEGYVRVEMMGAGSKKVETPEVTVSLSSSSKVGFTDASLVPSQLMRVYPPKTTIQEPAPDKAAIMTQLKAGEIVPGCFIDTTHKLKVKHHGQSE